MRRAEEAAYMTMLAARVSWFPWLSKKLTEMAEDLLGQPTCIRHCPHRPSDYPWCVTDDHLHLNAWECEDCWEDSQL